jgi:hypothetical protein
MIVFDRAGATDPAFDFEQARLVALLSDMELLRAGVPPEDLAADAPLLDHWLIAHRPASCLLGQSTGHPLLPGVNREIVTSDLMLMSRDHLWARTLSRWYCLGRPAAGERQDS